MVSICKASKMEACFMKQSIAPGYTIFCTRYHFTNSRLYKSYGVSLFSRRVNRLIRYPRFTLSSKRYLFQDFQDFAKPLRLLPSTEAIVHTNYISEEIGSSEELDSSYLFYMVELRTSKDFGSGLSDLNAGILLCLIDIDGDSILQRITAASLDHLGQRAVSSLESSYFQRSSVDLVTFRGSKLGKIEALWIGVESGSWRLDSVGLTIIHGSASKSNEKGLDGLQYKFNVNNILLGEGGVPVAEFRPVLVNELSTAELPTILSWKPSLPDSDKISIEEGMKEYADLKLSLLLYDLILVSTGSTVLAFSSSEKAAYSFLIGGIAGFLYLLLLQRSVDGLSSETFTADGEAGNFVRAFGGFKGPLLSLSLALVTSVLIVKYGIADSSVPLTAADLFAGVAGFLACKIAVVLAAFKPFRRSLKENV